MSKSEKGSVRQGLKPIFMGKIMGKQFFTQLSWDILPDFFVRIILKNKI